VPNIKSHRNSSNRNRVNTNGQTDGQDEASRRFFAIVRTLDSDLPCEMQCTEFISRRHSRWNWCFLFQETVQTFYSNVFIIPKMEEEISSQTSATFHQFDIAQ